MFILNEKNRPAERNVPKPEGWVPMEFFPDDGKEWNPSLAEIDRMIAEEDRRREKEDGRE